MASLPREEAQQYKFGPFVLDAHSGELRKHGLKLKISGQPIQVLTQLLERPGQLVTREEIRQRLWSADTFVDFDHSLNSAIKRLRQTLLDDPDQPRYIETIPRRGYRFIADLETDLSAAPIISASSQPVIAPESQQQKSLAGPTSNHLADSLEPSLGNGRLLNEQVHRRWALTSIASIVVVVVAVSAGTYFMRRNTTPAQATNGAHPANWEIEPITTYPGYQSNARLSPDGQYIAFFWIGTPGGEGPRLYVKAIGTEEPRAIGEPGPGSAAWSPDGRLIAYTISSKVPTVALSTTPAIYTVSPFGGPSRKLASDVGIQPHLSWSPDGKSLVFLKRANGDAPARAYVLSLDTLEQKPLDPHDCGANCPDEDSAAFSPDGRWIALVSNWADLRFTIDLYPVNGGAKRTIANVPGYAGGLDWTPDSHTLVFGASSTYPTDLVFQLKQVDVDSGAITDLGIEGSEPTLSRRGDRLAFAHRRRSVNIWRTELTGRNAGQSSPLIQSTRTQEAAQYSPDGKKIVFESSRSGSMEIWVANADGTDPVQMTRTALLSGSPQWSPNGKLIAYDSLDEKRRQHIFVMDAQTGVSRRIETGTPTACQPSWSPDGKYLYFGTSELAVPSVRTHIYKVATEGGQAVQLTEGSGGSWPRQLEDSDWVYYQRDYEVWRVRTDGSGEEQVEGIPRLASLADFLVIPKGIYFIAGDESPPVIRFFDFTTKATRQIATLQQPRSTWQPALSVSPDGRYLLYSQPDTMISDLLLVKNFKP